MNNNAPVRASGGGRKRKTTTQHKSSLTRINPPAELVGPHAVNMWKQQSKILIERGTFEVEDAPLLQAYCNAFQRMLEADIRINTEGLTVSTADGSTKMNPVINAHSKYAQQFSRFGSLLGLDPLTRLRMMGGEGGSGDGDEGNEFDGY